MEENNNKPIKDKLGNDLLFIMDSFRETPSMENLLRIVDTYHRMGHTERGVGFAEAFLMQIEDEKDRLLNSSMVFGLVEWNEEALSSLREAVEKFPEDASIKKHYGMLLNKLSEFESSLSIYNDLLKNNPNSLESLSGKLIALTGIGKHGDILNIYKKSIGITPSAVEDWHFKGVIDGILEDYFEHQKDVTITQEQAEKISKSFDSIKRVTEGLASETRSFYMMGTITGKGIYKEMLDKGK